MLKMLSLGVACAMLAVAPASAAEYAFTIGGGSTATGILTVNDVANVNGGSLITAITGTYNNQAITGLLGPGGFGGNNNLLFIDQNPLLGVGGFSFNGAFGNRNVFFNGVIYRDFQIADVTFSIARVAAGVPEPGTWAMMLIGFGAVGAAMRRRRRTDVAAIA